MSTVSTDIDFICQDILNQYILTQKLESYLDLLEIENKKINIVSRETSRDNLKFLIAESVLPLSYINHVSFDNYLDIGSGGGLPSIPLILSDKISSSTLVERKKKKADSLSRLLSSLEIINNVNIVNKTVEELTFEEQFDLITLRLVKLTPKIFKIISSLLSSTSVAIYYSVPGIDIVPKNYILKRYSYSNESKTTTKSFTLISKK